MLLLLCVVIRCLHRLYADALFNGKRVLLSKFVGAGTANGSFDTGGYYVFVTYNICGGDGEVLEETR